MNRKKNPETPRRPAVGPKGAAVVAAVAGPAAGAAPGFADVEAFLAALRADYDRLSRQLKAIARHVDRHRDRLALDGIQQTADACEVQPSAVVRFAKHFGFSGYSAMQALFREGAARQLAPDGDYQGRIRALVDATAGSGGQDALASTGARRSRGARVVNAPGPARIAREVVAGSIDSLQALQRSLQAPDFDEAFERAVSLLVKAPALWLVASRRAFPVGAYLAYSLQHTGKPVHWLHGLGHMQQGQLRALKAGDALVAVSFEPYAQETLDVLTASRERGARVLAITDSSLSPLARQADAALLVKDSATFGFRSLTSTLCMAQSLFLALAYRLELAYETPG